jgi:hypothetical protein
MARLHIKEGTSVETSYGKPCEECTKLISKDAEGLERVGDCAGESTTADAYINSPEYGNMLIIPSATSLADATNKALRCGGGYPVNCYGNPILACAPYVRCNL